MSKLFMPRGLPLYKYFSLWVCGEITRQTLDFVEKKDKVTHFLVLSGLQSVNCSLAFSNLN